MSTGNTRTLTLTGAALRLTDVEAVTQGHCQVELSAQAWQNVAAGRACVDKVVELGIPAYGITTGVGSQKDYAIGAQEAADYNALLVRAHGSRGPGPMASAAQLRGALTIHLNAFASGASGIRSEVVQALLDWLHADDWPEVRLGHSVGAADLMSLGQLADAFLAFCARGDGPDDTRRIDSLAAKEGLSFLNSNCLTLSQGALALRASNRLLAGMNRAAALSLEGFRGNPNAWSERGDRLHPQAGQITAGQALRELLAGSALWQADAPRLLQDPLSLRCVPQIHGACYAALDWATSIWETEINAVVDNPTVDLTSGETFSHGNMETTLLTVTLDALRLALAKAVETAGERLHKVQWPAFSGLPTGLAETGGATGGVQFLCISHLGAAQVAAAKIASMPTLPHYRGQLCDGVEDVGGLAPFAVTECERLIEAAWTVAAVEATIGAWAIARRQLPVNQLGQGIQSTYEQIRELLPIGHEGEKRFDLDPIVNLLKQASTAS